MNPLKILLAWIQAIFESAYTQALRFVYDTRAVSDYTAPVMVVIAGIMWVIMTPILVDQVQNTNTTGWSFTGYTGAITLFQLIPFVFIAGGIVWILKKVL